MICGKEAPEIAAPLLVESAQIEIISRIIRQTGCCDKHQQQHLDEHAEVDWESQRLSAVAQGPLRKPQAHAFEDNERSCQYHSTIPADRPGFDGELMKAEGD